MTLSSSKAPAASAIDFGRLVKRHAALVGMPALLVAALAFTVWIHPDFGPFDVQSLALGALPLAMAAAAQAIVVLSGGIDLSIGSLMAVANVLAATSMQHADFKTALLYALLILIAGLLQGLLTGLIVVLSRIPDVVVTQVEPRLASQAWREPS